MVSLFLKLRLKNQKRYIREIKKMTALDFLYDEFVAFCNKYDLVEQFNKGLQIKGFPYELSCKPFILSRLSPEIFNHSLHWAETPTQNHIHGEKFMIFG